MFPYLALPCVTVVEAVFDCLCAIAKVVHSPEGRLAQAWGRYRGPVRYWP